MQNKENLCLLADLNCRHSYQYFLSLIRSNVIMKHVILLDFKIQKSLNINQINRIVSDFLQLSWLRRRINRIQICILAKRYGVRTFNIKLQRLDDHKLIKQMQMVQDCAFIYTAGGIVPNIFFSEHEFKILHCHLGYIPDYKGSDCMVWSSLIEGKIGASVFYMTKDIDSGLLVSRMRMPLVILARKRFFYLSGKRHLGFLNKVMDPLYRANFLALTLRSYRGFDYRKLPVKDVNKDHVLDYTWVHPSLNELVGILLKSKIKVLNNFGDVQKHMEIENSNG